MKLLRVCVLAVIAAACGGSNAGADASSGPLRLKYENGNGPVSPPYHYDYTLLVQDSAGSVEWRAGTAADTATWTERFAVTPPAMAHLRAVIDSTALLTRKWAASEPANGAPAQGLTGSIGTHTVTIPAHVAPADQPDADRVYRAVEKTAPDSAWVSFRKKQWDFEQAHKQQ